jgi:hypothetical protein
MNSADWKEPIFDVVVCGMDGKFKTERLLPGEYSIIAESYAADKSEPGVIELGERAPAFVGRAAVTVLEAGPPPQVTIEIRPRSESKSSPNPPTSKNSDEQEKPAMPAESKPEN